MAINQTHKNMNEFAKVFKIDGDTRVLVTLEYDNDNLFVLTIECLEDGVFSCYYYNTLKEAINAFDEYNEQKALAFTGILFRLEN